MPPLPVQLSLKERRRLTNRLANPIYKQRAMPEISANFDIESVSQPHVTLNHHSTMQQSLSSFTLVIEETSKHYNQQHDWDPSGLTFMTRMEVTQDVRLPTLPHPEEIMEEYRYLIALSEEPIGALEQVLDTNMEFDASSVVINNTVEHLPMAHLQLQTNTLPLMIPLKMRAEQEERESGEMNVPVFEGCLQNCPPNA
ncbi:hypothetical protein K439DRAFT_1641112 [Ramaria rubella]|nr:hypothetical protein K439DRAFT_1641112 [Ramaria rubella]